MALRLSEWLGLGVEKAKPLQAGGVPAMPDVGDRRNAGAPEVLKVGIAGCATERVSLLATNGDLAKPGTQACEIKARLTLAKR